MNKIILLIFVQFIMFSQTLNAEWEHISSLPTPRFGMASVVHEEYAYFIGGNPMQGDSLFALDEVLSFNFDLMEWDTYIQTLNVPRSGATAVVYHGAIYVFGGKGQDEDNYVSEIEVKLPGEYQWRIAGSLSPERTGMTSVVYNDTIFISGGYNHASPNRYYSDVDAFVLDPEVGNGVLREVTAGFSLPSPRSNHGLVVVDSLLVMFGGYYAGGSLNDCYRYNGYEWTENNALVLSLSNMGSTVIRTVDESIVMTTGGLTHTGETSRGFISKYPFDHWNNFLDNLPFERSNHSLVSCMKESNRVMVISAGGAYDDGILNWPLEEVLLNQFNLTDLPVKESKSNLNLPEMFNLTAYPNPFNSHVTICLDFAGNYGSNLDVRLLNILGQELTHWTLNPTNNLRFSWDGMIDGKPAPAGLYLLSANNGFIQKTAKIYRLP